MTLIGIDPGASGAIVALSGQTVLLAEPLPVAKKVGLLLPDLADMLEGFAAPNSGLVYVIVERAQSFPRQGVSSAFNYGMHYGSILGVLAALGVPYETVPPAVWHKALCGQKRPGEGRPEAKARALQVVQQRLPGLVLPKANGKREGIVDAACIVLWAQLRNPTREVA